MKYHGVSISIINRLLAAVGAAFVLWGMYLFLWPLIDGQGQVTTGGYREIEIGDSKGEVVLTAMTSIKHSRLKLVGYRCQGAHLVSIVEPDCPESIYDSDEWNLLYPSINKETIIVFFEEGRVVKIEYFRDMLSP